MEYIYTAVLIHKCGGKVDQSTVKRVIEAAGGKPDEGKIKALVAAMANVDIDKAIKEATIPVASAAPVGSVEVKKEEKKEEEKVSDEKAAAGLSSLFG